MTLVFASLLLGAPQTVTPVVQVAAPHGEIGVADVLINSVSLIGVLALLAALVGVATGALFILFRRWRDAQSDELPLASYTRLGLSAGDQDLTSTPRS
jgi:hypothetical protein